MRLLKNQDIKNQDIHFDFQWITTWEEIFSEEFQSRWLQWMDQAGNSHVFFHPALCKAWIDTYRPIRNLKPLFCIAQSGSQTIFFPLVLWRQNWKNAFRKLIVPVGYSDFDYHDPLLIGCDSTVINDFFNSLFVELKANFAFDKIDIKGIRTVINSFGWVKENELCPFCELGNYQNSDDFLKSLKTSLRGDLNRQQRRMSEFGSVTIHYYSKRTADCALEVLPEFLHYHRLRWPNAYKAPGFHKLLLKLGLETGIVDFSELKLGENVVSWHLGFKYMNRFYYYMPAIKPDYAKLSPGKVHLLYLVLKCIEEKVTIFDHLRGSENYKAGWTNQLQYIYAYKENSSKPASVFRNALSDNLKSYLIR